MENVTKINGKVLVKVITDEVKSLYPSLKDKDLNESIYYSLKDSSFIRGMKMYIRSKNQLFVTSELEILGYYPKLVVEYVLNYISSFNLLGMTPSIVSSIARHAYEAARNNYINTVELEAIKSHSTIAGEWF